MPSTCRMTRALGAWTYIFSLRLQLGLYIMTQHTLVVHSRVCSLSWTRVLNAASPLQMWVEQIYFRQTDEWAQEDYEQVGICGPSMSVCLSVWFGLPCLAMAWFGLVWFTHTAFAFTTGWMIHLGSFIHSIEIHAMFMFIVKYYDIYEHLF